MQPAIVFRPTVNRGYAVVTWVVAAVVLLAFTLNGGVGELVRYGALPLALAALGWAAFWRPDVRVERAGVRVTNVLATVWLPWETVTGTRTRWGLELLTHERAVGAWALPSRSVLGRWTTRQQAAPALPAIETLDDDVSGGGDPLVAADLVEEHKTGHLVTGGAGPRPERRLDPLPAGLLLALTALAVVSLLR